MAVIVLDTLKGEKKKELEEGRELSVVRPCVYWCVHIIFVFKVVLASMRVL